MGKTQGKAKRQAQRFTRDYYKVEVPSDYSEDPAERFNVAYTEAEARTKLWCMPCQWEMVKDTGEEVTIRRTRYASKRTYSVLASKRTYQQDAQAWTAAANELVAIAE